MLPQAAVDEEPIRASLAAEMRSAAGTFKIDLTVRRGAGARTSAVKTSLLNSLEGRRGWPRMKPALPGSKGIVR